jgi:hypothetical protein
MASEFRLQLKDATLAPSLAFFLRRHGCRVEITEDATLTCEPPHDLHEAQGRLELELYVRLWTVLYNDEVTMLD